MIRILFQGDSITDAGRDRSDIHDLGSGYPLYAAEYIRKAYPGVEFEFMNTGISGDRTESLVARWQEEAIDLRPDIISILVGINDTWHHSDPSDNWEKNEYYEHCYRSLLEDVKNKTDAKILMIEQFLLYTPDKAFFRFDLAPKIELTRKLAREYADAYIPMDGLFAKASIEKEPTHWAADGVHPTAEGAALIGACYLEAVRPLIDGILEEKKA